MSLSVASSSAYRYAVLNTTSPSPLALKPTTGPGLGGLKITLFGLNFGSSLVATPSQMQLSLGGTDCSPSLTWTSDSAVAFTHPPGVLPGLAVLIAADPLLSGNLQNAFGFAKPILTGISPALQPTSGQSDITFFGLSFGGNAHDLARLKIGSTSCRQTTWLSDSSARCRIASGVAKQLTAVYSIGGYTAMLTRVFSYVGPVVGGIRPSYGNTRGGNYVSITGNFFGYGALHLRPHQSPHPSAHMRHIYFQDFISNRFKSAPACVRGLSSHLTPLCDASFCLVPVIF
jgi:hypothetical protein